MLTALGLAVLVFLFSKDYRPVASKNTANTNTNATTNAAATNQSSTSTSAEPKAYTDTDLGFSLTYPSSWTVQRDASGEGENAITNIRFSDDETGATLIVAPASLKGLVTETFNPTDETSVTINGQTATRSVGTQEKDGSKVHLLSFEKGGTLYLLNGEKDAVDALGASFRLDNQ